MSAAAGTRHSEGRWLVDTNVSTLDEGEDWETDVLEITNEAGFHVGSVRVHYRDGADDETEIDPVTHANARLLTSAPELFTLVEMIANDARGGVDPKDVAIALVAKIRGAA